MQLYQTPIEKSIHIKRSLKIQYMYNHVYNALTATCIDLMFMNSSMCPSALTATCIDLMFMNSSMCPSALTGRRTDSVTDSQVVS